MVKLGAILRLIGRVAIISRGDRFALRRQQAMRYDHAWPIANSFATGLNDPSMSTRVQNEKKFGQWDEMPDGGRRYWRDVPGRSGWLARYVKEVDSSETTLRFWQEIYDDQRRLIELHEKYPVDKGHRPTYD